MDDRLHHIEVLPSGKHRVRIEVRGVPIRETVTTEAEAIALRDSLLRKIADDEVELVQGSSLKEIGARFLHSRLGHRAYKDDESRWYQHIESAPIARRPMNAVQRTDVIAWLDSLERKACAWDPKVHGARARRTLGRSTRRHCLNLLRRAFAWAVDRGLAEANPAFGVSLKVTGKRVDDEDEDYRDGWYLDPSQQARLLSLYDEIDWEAEDIGQPEKRRAEKTITEVAIALGVRKRELWCLHLADIHVAGDEPHVVIRYGSWDPVKERYRSPKGTKSRKVPLWGPALEAMKRWLEVLPSYAPKNPLELAFPTERGARRFKAPTSWVTVAKRFGVDARIGRRPWWHLLRHTCASSLVSGWWGVRWSLRDVQQILGHTTSSTTERYAHLAPSVVQASAAQAHAAWVAALPRTVHGEPRRGVPTTRNERWRARRDSNPEPSASKGDRSSGPDRAAVDRWQAVAELLDALRGVQERAPGAPRRLADALIEHDPLATTKLIDAAEKALDVLRADLDEAAADEVIGGRR